MYKYFTKTFEEQDHADAAALREAIDTWLNSFVSNEPMGRYNMEPVGWGIIRNTVVITVRVWDSR